MIRLILALTLFALTGLFCIAYYDRFHKWRDCFNELGRCFDANTGNVMLEQAGIIWGTLACLCLLAAIYQVWRHVNGK